MSVKQLESPCWVSVSYDLADDSADSTHYASGTHDATPAEDSTHPLPERCWVVTCDTDGCGETLGNEEYDEVHWESEAQALKVAEWDEWIVGPEGAVTCPLHSEDDNE